MGGGCEIARACHLVVADATAQEALGYGLVNRVVAAGAALDGAAEILAAFAQKRPPQWHKPEGSRTRQ